MLTLWWTVDGFTHFPLQHMGKHRDITFPIRPWTVTLSHVSAIARGLGAPLAPISHHAPRVSAPLAPRICPVTPQTPRVRSLGASAPRSAVSGQMRGTGAQMLGGSGCSGAWSICQWRPEHLTRARLRGRNPMRRNDLRGRVPISCIM